MTAASGLRVRLPTSEKRSGMRPSSASALGRPSAQASPTLATSRSISGLPSIHSSTDVPPMPLPARIDWSTGFVTQPARSGAFSAMRFSTSAGRGGTLSPSSSHWSAVSTERPPPPPPRDHGPPPAPPPHPQPPPLPLSLPALSLSNGSKGERPHVSEGEEHIDQLLDGVHRDGAGLDHGGVPDVALARQRRRVRRGGAASGGCPSPLQHHHRLRGGGGLQRRQEPPSVPHALHVRSHHRSLSIGGEVLQEVGLVQVNAVAVADGLGEAQAARLAEVRQLEQQVPALR